MNNTPGPWILESEYPDTSGYKVRGGSLAFIKGPRLIALVKNQDTAPITEDSLSDARLIAAAPELLDALRDEISEVADLAAECQKGLMARCRCRTCRRERSLAVIAKVDGK